ncbi:MAG: hypothetical protein ACRETC_08685 [Gammaproteobacteria bacterium]
MTRNEKVELTAVPVLGIGFWLVAPLLPDRLSIGALLLVAAVLLLLQSLVRDVALLTQQRRVTHSGSQRAARCMCIESAIGVTGVAAGLALLGAGLGRSFAMPPWAWGVLAVIVTGFGFVIKDYVVTWTPWRIRRDKDHVNIVISWKR